MESGAVTTGASVLVEGIVVSSQGSKQKVELKVARLVTVMNLFHTLVSLINFLKKSKENFW